MAGVEVEIIGLDDVVNKLQRLANPRRTKSLALKASRQAMNIVRDAARNNAKAIDDPETTEKIWKNISVSAGKTKNPNEIRMRVGVRGGASFSNPNPPNTSGGDTRHWRWVEFGSSHQPAVPFMRPALASNIQQVTNKFAEVFDTELDKELLK